MNFLDIILNLENSTYRRYLKDNKIIYVNIESNHALSIIKQVPKSIELRLSQLSANEDIFKNSRMLYNEALTKTGYKHETQYERT